MISRLAKIQLILFVVVGLVATIPLGRSRREDAAGAESEGEPASAS